MDKASIQDLGSLHGYYVQTLSALLDKAQKSNDPDEILSVLKEIRLFLKDNEIKAEIIPEKMLNLGGLEISKDDLLDLKRS